MSFLVLSGAGGGGDPGGDSPVTADLQASRTSGPAPLAVFFDATGTTHTDGDVDTFRLGYYFDFDDAGAGDWTYSQNGTHDSKEYARGGPLCAHVFESPGTYTVKVRARDADGEVSDDSVEITVADPDTTYSGTNTICLSRNTDHTGAPAGASLQNNVSSWPSEVSNRRYLLHAGQDFSSLGTWEFGTVSDIQVGVYGSGAKPIVAGIGIENTNPGASKTTYASQLSFTDLELTGRVTSTTTHTDVLFLRLEGIDGDTSNTGLELGGATGFYANPANSGATTAANIFHPRNTFIVDCTVPGGSYNFTMSAQRLALMGSLVGPSETHHNVRLWSGHKLYIAHNLIGDAVDASDHNLKIHSAGTDTWPDLIADGDEPATSQVVVQENIFGVASGEGSIQSVVFAAQNNDGAPYIEGLEDIVCEDNHWANNFASGGELFFGGRRMTDRGNTSVGTLSVVTSSRPNGIPSGWDGPYYTGESSITTQAPA
jgi:hypothetical protein